jgi:hypothetical protein
MRNELHLHKSAGGESGTGWRRLMAGGTNTSSNEPITISKYGVLTQAFSRIFNFRGLSSAFRTRLSWPPTFSSD